MRILLAALIILSTFSVFCQRWLDVGLKGGYGTMLLMNSNLFSDNNYNHKLTGAYTLGGKLGYNLSNNHEITVDVMYSKFSQNFQFGITDTASRTLTQYTQNFSYNALDFILMYRSNKDGRYFEIGPKYSLISNAIDRNDIDLNGSTPIDNFIVPNTWGVVVGFGNYFFGTDNFGITFGARIGYDFTDIVSLDGQRAGYPPGRDYTNYATSTPLSLMLVTEFNFDFGYIAKANCGERKKLIIF